MGLSVMLAPCLWAFLASAAFSIFFNVHGVGILVCALGGALGRFVYLLSAPLGGELLRFFFAAAAISAYSEGMARLRKCPVTGYLLVAFFPLVPGGGIYHTMKYAIDGNIEAFLSTGLHTLGVAGTLAAGVLSVSTLVQMGTTYRRQKRPPESS